MAGPVFADRVAEITSTTGTTRPYVLAGTFEGNATFASKVTDGDWLYYEATDGSARRECGKATFTAPDLLTPTEYISTSNGGAAVNWAVRPIIRLVSASADWIAGLVTRAEFAAYVYSAPLTGATVTLSEDQHRLLIDPAATIAALNVVLPPSPADQDQFALSTSRTITLMTVTAPGGAAVNGGSQMLTANGGMAWVYRAANTRWYRI